LTALYDFRNQPSANKLEGGTMAEITITEADGWLTDSNGNRASIAYFGSREKAVKALRSLEDCPPIPAISNIHRTIYAAASQPEALYMAVWHACENTHCRAGWAVHLAGEAGRKLERFYNTELAAILIYRASGYEINPARFYETSELALADMKRLAEAEAAS